jgi:hypothetical protein
MNTQFYDASHGLLPFCLSAFAYFSTRRRGCGGYGVSGGGAEGQELLVEMPSYLDRTTDDQPRMALAYPATEDNPEGEVIAVGRQFPATWVTPKERHLLDTLRPHLDAGEKPFYSCGTRAQVTSPSASAASSPTR